MPSYIKLNVKFNKINLEAPPSVATFVQENANIFCKMLPDSESFYKFLGEQIKFERMKKKINQENLADHLGLSRTSIMNIETARHKPSLYQVLQIAIYLNIDYTSLIPYKFSKPDSSVSSLPIELKGGFTDQGKVNELDKPSQSAINKFLSDLDNQP